MLKQLMNNKEQYLYENFRLTNQFSEESISIKQLLHERTLLMYLHQIKNDLGTDSLYVAASQFMKRMGYVLAVPFLYSMTILDKKLTIHLLDSLIVSKTVKQTWMPNLYIPNDSLLNTLSTNRSHNRKEALDELFGTIALMIDKLAKVSSVPKSVLWENVAIYVYWLYKKKLKEEEFLVYQDQMEQDFSYLLNEIPGHIFHQSKNPLQYFYAQKPQNDEKSSQPRVRKTCCFYYKTTQSNGSFCGGCPKKCH
ncbi:(2Fe-2S)-binding protein [Bacillaceae bacterium S4-13-58]